MIQSNDCLSVLSEITGLTSIFYSSACQSNTLPLMVPHMVNGISNESFTSQNTDVANGDHSANLSPCPMSGMPSRGGNIEIVTNHYSSHKVVCNLPQQGRIVEPISVLLKFVSTNESLELIHRVFKALVWVLTGSTDHLNSISWTSGRPCEAFQSQVTWFWIEKLANSFLVSWATINMISLEQFEKPTESRVSGGKLFKTWVSSGLMRLLRATGER